MQPIRRILVPIDFNPPSRKALELAQRLAVPCDAEIYVLYVDDDVLLNAATTSQQYRDQFEDQMAMKLVDLFSAEERQRFRAHFAVVRGNAATEIGRYAVEHRIDLIVLGNVVRSSFADALLGSVADKVLRTAPCPVVSVKSRKSS